MKRAIGIVRVSQVGKREGERFVSPTEQRERIEAACKRDGLRLVEVHEELDVSGGKTLADRPGLSLAVAAVEAGRADVVAAAYFDRLFRSLSTQAEVVERVEAAGGQVLAVDVGQVSSASAAQWLSGMVMGTVSEYHRRSIGERSREGQARAVARGAIMWARVPLGYSKRPDATLEICEADAALVRRAFERRADGDSITTIRRWLATRGVQRSPRGVEQMLGTRIYLGEIHYGKLSNLSAHDPIVDADLWARAQRTVGSRGRLPMSDMLLARLGVLRCGNCGKTMGAASLLSGAVRTYQCRYVDCSRRLSIHADVVEGIVTDAVRSALQDVHGSASRAESAQDAVSRLSSAQATLDAYLRVLTLSGAENESSAVERIAELRKARDDAQAQVDQIGPDLGQILGVAPDWPLLALDEQRAFIKATVASIVIAPATYVGRGNRDRAAERVAVNLRS